MAGLAAGQAPDFPPKAASEPPPGQNWNSTYIGSDRWKENERLKAENLERIKKRVEELNRLKERVFARRKAEADAKAKPMPAGPKPMPAAKMSGQMPVGPKPMPAGPKPAGPQVKAMPKVPKAPGGPQAVPKAKAAGVAWFLHNSTVVIESVSDEEPPPNQKSAAI